jgi:choline dehydrogenase
MESKTYTHIVVGAGSAGCVVAARIAENRGFNVLLLEAGLDCDPNVSELPLGVQDSRRIPMRGQSEIFDPALDWNIDVALPQGGSMQVPQAKAVGGGSSINGGTALRSTVADSEEWLQLGNDNWDFDSVYQVYESLEGDQFRGTHGPHPIVRTPVAEAGKIQRAFLDGAVETGMPMVQDLNATGAEGVGPSPVCRRGNHRVSAANTFIDPIRNRANFTILPSSLVDKVLFSGGRACGVLLASGQAIHASQEVIICAGAILSPALLQRSGVGPSRLLEAVQIGVVSNLPVGKNLSDHPCIPVVSRPRGGMYEEGDYSLQMQARWSSTQRPGAIDLQMVCFSYLFVPLSAAQGARSLAGTATGHVAGIGCNVNKPTSTGSVAIRSRNATEYPAVTPNYLQTDHDRRAAREGVRRTYRVMTTPAMQRVLEEPLTLTRCTVEDDDALDGWILSQLSSTYHFCGSCRMAARGKGGVVDQSGRVYGVQGLRVADASVIPTVPASNTMWTTMMFAERIGHSIRDGVDVGAASRGLSRLRSTS